MKHKLLILAIIIVPLISSAQRHLEGMKEIRVGAGITKLGTYGTLGFGYNLKAKLAIGGDVTYEIAKSSGIGISTGLLNLGISFNPVNIKETIYFNLLAGIAGSYAALDDISGLKENTKENGINLGGYAGTELDFYLTDKFILTAHYKQFYLPMQFMGKAIYLIGGGFKISIN